MPPAGAFSNSYRLIVPPVISSACWTELARWVRDERRRVDTVAGGSDEPLTPAERAELLRLRRLVAEQEKDLAFLGKAAAYFARDHR